VIYNFFVPTNIKFNVCSFSDYFSWGGGMYVCMSCNTGLSWESAFLVLIS
jgi:hypothetical protein